MAFFEWTDELSIGIELIDSQHKMLISIINEFHNSIKNKGGDEAIFKAVGNLINYVGIHFSAEEKLMQEHNYPQLGLHRQIHKRLTEDVISYAEKLEAGQKILSLDMAIFLKGWLENHIAQTDKKIGIFLTDKR